MTYGFIGTGNMGTLLIEAFVTSGAIPPKQIWIYNRTREKAERIVRHYKEIKIAEHISEIIRNSNNIFICVRPSDYPTVLQEIQQLGQPEQTVVSITSSVMLSDLENSLLCKVIKIIPSITNAALAGAMLTMYGSKISAEEKTQWNNLFSYISTPIEIEENYVRVSSDLTSCGPAFLSFILQNMISHAIEQTSIPKELATQLVTEMIIGYGKLLSIGKYSLETLQEQVIVPGGVTGVGIHVLQEEIGPLFAHMFQKTHKKFEEDVKESKEWIKHLFSSS